jgi:zinc-ribbon domain
VRFFAHDGKEFHGPATVEELLRLPGFDGDTLVCPVGSANSADWKPAFSYPPLREALLAQSQPALAPPPPAPPAPPPPPPTTPCPRCGHANPEDARFCNACAARMDGTVETPPASEPYGEGTPLAHAVEERSPTFGIPLEPFPEPLPLAPGTAPVESVPADPAPLADVAPPMETAQAPEPVLPVVAPAPAATESAAWRRPMLAAFFGAVIAGGGLGWWLLRPAPQPPLVLQPPAPAPTASPAASSPAPAATIVPSRAPVLLGDSAEKTSPAPLPPAAPRAQRARRDRSVAKAKTRKRRAVPAARRKTAPRRRVRPEPKPAPGAESDESLVTSALGDGEPTPPGAPRSSRTLGAPGAEPARGSGGTPGNNDDILLPGVPRPVAKRAPAGRSKRSPAPAQAAATAAAAAAPTPKSAENGATRQVREQFDFCSQLYGQADYGDYFDTCLCAAARKAAPYRGSRDAFASAMKKGAPPAPAALGLISLSGSTATVTALGKAAGGRPARGERQTWRLEDGLWCRASAP